MLQISLNEKGKIKFELELSVQNQEQPIAQKFSSQNLQEYEQFFKLARQQYDSVKSQIIGNISVDLQFPIKQDKIKLKDLLQILYQNLPYLRDVQINFEGQQPGTNFIVDLPFDLKEFSETIQSLGISFYEEDKYFQFQKIQNGIINHLKNLEKIEIQYITQNISQKFLNNIVQIIQKSQQLKQINLIDQSNQIFHNVFPEINFSQHRDLKNLDLCFRFQEKGNINLVVNNLQLEKGFEKLSQIVNLQELTLQSLPLNIPQNSLIQKIGKIFQNLKTLKIQDTYYSPQIKTEKQIQECSIELQVKNAQNLKTFKLNAGSNIKNMIINQLFQQQNSLQNLENFELNISEQEESQVSNIIDFSNIFKKIQEGQYFKNFSVDFQIYYLDLLETKKQVIQNTLLEPLKNFIMKNEQSKNCHVILNSFQFEDFEQHFGVKYVQDIIVSYLKSNNNNLILDIPDNVQYQSIFEKFRALKQIYLQFYEYFMINGGNNNSRIIHIIKLSLKSIYSQIYKQKTNQNHKNCENSNEEGEEEWGDEDSEFEDESD